MLGGGLSNKHNSLKLKKFKGNNSRRKVIITTIILSILLLSGIYLYSSFAAFTEEKHFNVINGEVTDPGDIYFAYYVDGEITRSIPTEGSGYTLDIEKSNCTNGVSISFDDYNYAVITSYKNYNATDYTRTRCNLYFEKLDMQLTDYIKRLALYDNPNLTYDGTIDNNLRYIGSNPNNYVSVDGELWRIIGVMNNIDDGTGKKESRIKLIRAESIGHYSWDVSENSVNYGNGINEWSQADIMKLLNHGYESESVGGSLYWNKKAGTCYSGENNATTNCDFTSTGIKDKLKTLISDAVWNTGTNDGVTYTNNNWSDYFDCYNNNWLFLNNSSQWTITSYASSSLAVSVFLVNGNGGVNHISSNDRTVNPVVYLKSSVKIASGIGSKELPYILGV